jgi:hypothetical protein
MVGRGRRFQSESGLSVIARGVVVGARPCAPTGRGPGTGGDGYLCATSVGGVLQIQNGLSGAGKMVIGGASDCPTQPAGNRFDATHDMTAASHASAAIRSRSCSW